MGKACAYRPSAKAASARNSLAVTLPCPPRPWIRISLSNPITPPRFYTDRSRPAPNGRPLSPLALRERLLQLQARLHQVLADAGHLVAANSGEVHRLGRLLRVRELLQGRVEVLLCLQVSLAAEGRVGFAQVQVHLERLRRQVAHNPVELPSGGVQKQYR